LYSSPNIFRVINTTLRRGMWNADKGYDTCKISIGCPKGGNHLEGVAQGGSMIAKRILNK
jgi:hypothetical protein